MDHAGIATQSVVEKRLKEEGIDRHEIGREQFVERVWEWKEDYASRIRQQYQRLGASVDYERERFTRTRTTPARSARSSLPLRKGLHLPRQLHGQLGPRLAVGDLRPRGRKPRDDRHALLRQIIRSRAPTASSQSPRSGRKR